MSTIVGELEPDWVVVENVASGDGRWLSRARHDLRTLGYGTRCAEAIGRILSRRLSRRLKRPRKPMIYGSPELSRRSRRLSRHLIGEILLHVFDGAWVCVMGGDGGISGACRAVSLDVAIENEACFCISPVISPNLADLAAGHLSRRRRGEVRTSYPGFGELSRGAGRARLTKKPQKTSKQGSQTGNPHAAS